MALGALVPNTGLLAQFQIKEKQLEKSTSLHFESDWQTWPDMEWVGSEYWGNRLQDWNIREGKVVCQVQGQNRSLHCLTTQVKEASGSFHTEVSLHIDTAVSSSDQSYAGVRLGIKGKFNDYRSAAVHGRGLDIGLTSAGNLLIDDTLIPINATIPQEVKLSVSLEELNSKSKLKVSLQSTTGEILATGESRELNHLDISGNIGLVSHIAKGKEDESASSATFSEWKIEGSRLHSCSEHEYGPICFAQYTIHNNILKLTAQLCPVEQIKGHKVTLEVKEGLEWKAMGESTIDPMSRTVHFRHENWPFTEPKAYRISLHLPLKEAGDSREYYYEGSIMAQPQQASKVKAAVFSCNCDYGFPDMEVAPYVNEHRPDLALFLGDQFYESTGGFGIQTSPMDKAALDYLRKWMMFGWSYREIFRHIPCAIIPDDHDVYHGNIWGEAGKAADITNGWGAPAQDSGGYKMEPRWVNMVQKCQTSHLPDPYDPTPVKNGIEVYYTDWLYGGVSFAILEDRKWKSAPKHVLPEDADIWNGWIKNPDFDIKKHRVQADLLGDRQLDFLDHWAADWSGGAKMKALLTQTIFNTVATLPAEAMDDSVVPSMTIPKPGEYVLGDQIKGDMDSNGWPQVGRDQAVEKIRKCFAFHIAGDQHLASFTKYGVDDFGDGGFAFAGPALNNIWPRRWWPPVDNPQDYSDQNPVYTGNYEDGFGNKMTVKAIANPRLTGIEPAVVYDRATGYGIVTFDSNSRTITTECWPKYVNPAEKPDGQYAGWPITISQEDNFGKSAKAWLPEIKVNGMNNPIVEIIEEKTGQSLYFLSIKGNTFTPKVFDAGSYTIRIKDADSGKIKEKKGIKSSKSPKGTLMMS